DRDVEAAVAVAAVAFHPVGDEPPAVLDLDPRVEPDVAQRIAERVERAPRDLGPRHEAHHDLARRAGERQGPLPVLEPLVPGDATCRSSPRAADRSGTPRVGWS